MREKKNDFLGDVTSMHHHCLSGFISEFQVRQGKNLVIQSPRGTFLQQFVAFPLHVLPKDIWKIASMMANISHTGTTERNLASL